MLTSIGGIFIEKEFYNYIVYDDGRVYSKYKSRFLKPDIALGYEQYTLVVDGKPIRYKGHKLVAMMFVDGWYDGAIINHKDGNKRNNHYSNLEWCSYTENNKHARDTGLNPLKGESNGRSYKPYKYNGIMYSAIKLSEIIGVKAGTLYRGKWKTSKGMKDYTFDKYGITLVSN